MLHAGEHIGPYVLLNKLGTGGFGVVWLAERRTAIITTQVALKLPLSEEYDIDVIRQEANLWVQASGHPNILPIIEANIYNERVVIVSEYAPDGSLSHWLKDRRALPLETAIDLTIGILSGLEHLHSRNIIHRDLKPDNILLQGQLPRLADFGISRVLKSQSHSSLVAGTPAYMAPETFFGRHNAQTDLWSVGVILYRLLTGNLPFPQANLPQLMRAILDNPPDALAVALPESMQAILNRALAKSPTQRFHSAAEMRAALKLAYLQCQTLIAAPQAAVVDNTAPEISEPPLIIGTPANDPAPQSMQWQLSPTVRLLEDSRAEDAPSTEISVELLELSQIESDQPSGPVTTNIPMLMDDASAGTRPTLSNRVTIDFINITRHTVEITEHAHLLSSVQPPINNPIKNAIDEVTSPTVPMLESPSNFHQVSMLIATFSAKLSREFLACLLLLFVFTIDASSRFRINDVTPNWSRLVLNSIGQPKPSAPTPSQSEPAIDTKLLVKNALCEIDKMIIRVEHEVPRNDPSRNYQLKRFNAFKVVLKDYSHGKLDAVEARSYAESALSQLKSYETQLSHRKKCAKTIRIRR